MSSFKIFKLQSRLIRQIFTLRVSSHGLSEHKLIGSLHVVRRYYRTAETTQFITSHGNSAHLSYSTQNDGSKPFDANYDDILTAQKDDEVVIIDVREQDEINETGKLPGSIHIPMGKVTEYLTTLSNEEFKNKFQKEKPTKESKVILSCRLGKRSGRVQEEMQKLGYTNVYNYTGGWLDWESRQKS